MITVTEAEKIIKNHVRVFPKEYIDLSESLNHILSENITAERDYPPFNRVAMDGICINFSDFAKGQRLFKISGLQAAGSPPLKLSEINTGLEIMTGAMLSQGADTVIPYEQIEKIGDSFKINNEKLHNGANIHLKGKDTKSDSILIKAYTKIESHIIAILATEGIHKVPVLKMPKIAIVSTGDELVPIDTKPKDYQIRTSNSLMLKAALKKLNIKSSTFHINDNKELLKSKMSDIIKDFDVIMLSGGVSKGKLDYIPEILTELNVKKDFHRIAQRPGKPFWFGHKDDKLVFAFPGNPASSLVCYKRYFEYWLMLCLRQEPNNFRVKLKNSYVFKPQLTYFAQAKLIDNTNERIVEIMPGNGSGDIANFAQIDGFIELPSQSEIHDCNNMYTFYKI